MRLARILFFFLALALAGAASAQDRETTLGAGDVVRITVFQNPDLTTETRVSESGTITFPLIGNVSVGGLSAPLAEKRIADMLRTGGFVLQPQVNLLVVQEVNLLVVQGRSNQVSVLGMVNRPGRYPMDTTNTRLTDMLAQAGGAAATGDDSVILVGTRAGKPYRLVIDLPSLFLAGQANQDVLVQPGDTLYVPRAPMVYVYGEVQRPGAFRLERDMTVMQALALGGGPTLRGTLRNLTVNRKTADGGVKAIQPELTDKVQPEDVIYVDVIYVRESLF